MQNNIFVVQTPYQLMTVLNIIFDDINEKRNNIILLAHFSLRKYLPLCNNLRNTECIYEESLCLNYKVSSVFEAHLKIIRNILLLKRNCSNLKFPRTNVEQLFVPSEDVVCRVVYNYIKKKSKALKLSLYDEGNGTYIGTTFRRISRLGSFFYWLLLDNDYRDRIRSMYCYNPQLLDEKTKNIETIRVCFHEEVRSLLKTIVSDSSNKYIGKKIIFLDQGFRDNHNLNLCLALIEKYFSKENTLVKLHPRIEGKLDYNFDIIRDEIPFEIAASSLDFSDSITITCSSAGCIMQILMFGKNCSKAVFLQKICSSDERASKLMAFVKGVQDYYGKDTIFSPSTLDEFEAFLKDNQAIGGVREITHRKA